jgi:hypothetical protein
MITPRKVGEGKLLLSGICPRTVPRIVPVLQSDHTCSLIVCFREHSAIPKVDMPILPTHSNHKENTQTSKPSNHNHITQSATR